MLSCLGLCINALASISILHRCIQTSACCRSVKDFVKQYQQGHKCLDILVNNASVFIGKDEETEDGIEVGTALLHLFPQMPVRLPCLKALQATAFIWGMC